MYQDSVRPRLAVRKSAVATVAIIIATAVTLLWMGRSPICQCGYVKLWHGVILSPENSQHLTDWYTVTHFVQGFLLYLVTLVLMRQSSFDWRLFAATAVECAWEIFENTSFIIERYRQATISASYYGDSVVNSLGDILSMMLGLALAARLPVWLSIVIAIVAEAFLAWQIRDNLALNALMLIWPMDTVLRWQFGG